MTNIIFITGASSDIGLNLIRSIDEECLIIAHYNSSNKKLLELAEHINNKLVTLKADLSSEQETLDLLDEIETRFGTPKTIIHLAAPHFRHIRFKDIIWKQFQKEIDISLRSIILILNRFLPKLAKEKHGKVICMLSSVTLNVPPKALSQYIIVKYSLLGLVKSLASEYADKNIQINAISPSMIETKFLNRINGKLVELNAYHHPLKRNACTEDVIPAIKMLMGKGSDYITGANIPIAGGSIF